jgi:hypothetical protein
VFILASGIDAFVTDAVLFRLRGANLNRARQRLAKATDYDTALSDIAADEAMLVELAEDFAERRISRSAFHAATDRVQIRLDAAERNSLPSRGQTYWAASTTETRSDGLAGLAVSPPAPVRGRGDRHDDDLCRWPS